MSDDKQREYRRVYQGGHHDVWCNGATHKTCRGGWCHLDDAGGIDKPMSGRRDDTCDCADWKQAE